MAGANDGKPGQSKYDYDPFQTFVDECRQKFPKETPGDLQAAHGESEARETKSMHCTEFRRLFWGENIKLLLINASLTLYFYYKNEQM